tara:strand:- start:9907 stop:13347 length:3441 start_codon:yes stop_codon:yes gene_type:complete
MLNNKLRNHCAEIADKKNKYQEELKKIKANIFLGNQPDDIKIFSLAINATNYDDYETSNQATFLLSKPLGEQPIPLLLEYFRIIINKDHEHDKTLAPKLLKLLISKANKSFVIKTVIDSNNKSLRDFLLDKIQSHKRFTDREKLFLILELWKAKLITRTEADRRLRVFLSNASVDKYGFEKTLTRRCVMSQMLVTLIYLQMNLKSKAYKSLKIISKSDRYLEIVSKKSLYNDTFERYAREIFDRKLRYSNRVMPEYLNLPRSFNSLETNHQEYFSKPYNPSSIIFGGINTTDLIIFANEVLEQTKNTKFINIIWSLFKKINAEIPKEYASSGIDHYEYEYHELAKKDYYNHKKLISYIPFISNLNKVLKNKKVTLEINNFFIQKRNGYHDALFLLLPKNIYEESGRNYSRLKEKFINAFLRYRLDHGYYKSNYTDNTWEYYGSPSKLTNIFKHIYINATDKTRSWLEDLAIIKTLVDTKDQYDNDLALSYSADFKDYEGLSVALNYHQKNLGDTFLKNVRQKLLDTGNDQKRNYALDKNIKYIYKDEPVSKLTSILGNAVKSDTFELTKRAIKRLSLNDFAYNAPENKENKYLSSKSFMKSFNNFCIYFYNKCNEENTKNKLKKETSQYGYRSFDYISFIYGLIFFHADNSTYKNTYESLSLESKLKYLDCFEYMFKWNSKSAKRYSKLLDDFKALKPNESYTLVKTRLKNIKYHKRNKNKSYSYACDYGFLTDYKSKSNTILFSIFLDHFDAIEIKKLILECHDCFEMDLDKFGYFLQFFKASRFLYLGETNFAGVQLKKNHIGKLDKLKSILDEVLDDITAAYMKKHDLKIKQNLHIDSEIISLVPALQKRKNLFDADPNKQLLDWWSACRDFKLFVDDKEIIKLFNAYPEVYFNELWNMPHMLSVDNYSKINKDKFYPQLEKEIKKLLSSPKLNMKEMKFLEKFAHYLTDTNSARVPVEFKQLIDKYIILIENWIFDKFITNKIDYSYHDLLDLILKDNWYKNEFIFKDRNSKVKNHLVNLHKSCNSFNVQNAVFERLYKKRDAIKFLGKKSYLKIINSLFTVIENQTKKTDIKKIFKNEFNDIDEFARIEIQKIFLSKIKLNKNDMKIMLSRIDRLAFNKTNCDFCIQNNLNFWGRLGKIYE